MHLHSWEIGEKSENRWNRGITFFFPQAFGKTSSPCLSPNRSCVQGFSKENHCSSPPVLTFTGESPGDMRKVTASALLCSPFFTLPLQGGLAVSYFILSNPFSIPFWKQAIEEQILIIALELKSFLQRSLLTSFLKSIIISYIQLYI